MKLSVLIITYNQERYIAQALDSALSQETSFDCEIVVGEDCSTDTTRQVVAGYHRRHPDRIRPFFPERNLGMMANFVQTLDACRGQYVALLDGDDYWTSPRKLQAQVEFLDGNPGFSECCHRVSHVDADGRAHALFPPWEEDRDVTIEDLILENLIPTCSTVFRRELIGELPEWFSGLGLGDWPLHILNARQGRIRYFAEVMGAYRIHAGGAWSSHTEVRRLQETLRFFDLIDAHLGFKYHGRMRKGIARLCYHLAVEYDKLGEREKARSHAWRSLKTRPLQGRVYRYLLRSAMSARVRGKGRMGNS